MSVDELVPQAIEMAERTGAVPSRDRLMKTFRIGRPKAAEIYRRVQAESAKRRSRRHRKVTFQGRKGAFRWERRARVLDPSDIPVSPGMGPVKSLPEPPAQVPAAVPPTPSGRVPRGVRSWPLLLLALPAFVAIWSGWVGLGGLTGFGEVHPLPGIADWVELDTAITLPIGLETYAAFALYVWLGSGATGQARTFAMWSAVCSLALGAAGQVAFHLMTAYHMTSAPWLITTIVACLPVAVVGMGAALYHLVHAEEVSS